MLGVMLEGIGAIEPLTLLGYVDKQKVAIAGEAVYRDGRFRPAQESYCKRAVFPGTVTRSDLYLTPTSGPLFRA